MKRIVLKHILTWFMLSVTFFFLAEPLVKLLFPDVHNVGIWLFTEFIGLMAILLIIVSSLIVTIARKRKL